MQGRRPGRSALLLNMIMILGLALPLSGCFQKQARVPVFFPPAPNAPHVQYLTSISTVNDIRPSILNEKADPEETISKPYGIAVKGSRIYVSDVPFARLSIIDLADKTLKPMQQNTLQAPINIAFDGSGNTYVADTGLKAVVLFSDDKVKKFTLGDTKPTDMAIRGNELLVLDYRHSAIKVVDMNSGTVIGTIGRDAGKGEMLSLPANMTLDKDGNIYTTNMGTCRVIKMDRNGKVLKAFGELGDRPSQFTRPKGIAVDDNGYIYVVDSGSQVVQIFDQEGRLLMFFGERGSKEGTLNIPADIVITRENLDYFRTFAAPSFEVEHLILVTNQSGPRKISVYGFGHSKETTPPPQTAKN